MIRRPELVGHRLCVAAYNGHTVSEIVSKYPVQYGREVGLVAESLLFAVAFEFMAKQSSHKFGKKELAVLKGLIASTVGDKTDHAAVGAVDDEWRLKITVTAGRLVA